jgi:alkylation response protein AidB-like acyl-CoA dehydrogenase
MKISDNDKIIYEGLRRGISSQYQGNVNKKELTNSFLALVIPKNLGGMELGLKISTILCEETAALATDMNIIQQLIEIDLLYLSTDHSEKLVARKTLYHTAYLFGIAHEAYRLTLERIKDRKQFDRKIIDNQRPRFQLAEIFSKLEIYRQYYDYVIFTLETNETGCFECAEWFFTVIKDFVTHVLSISLQLHGAYGLTEEAKIQKLYRLYLLHLRTINNWSN